MLSTDPISDMLTRIRNAYMVQKDEVVLPSAKLKISILEVLKKEGYIEDFKEDKDGFMRNVSVKLKFDNNKPAISFLEKVSKPGRRVYSGKSEIPVVLSGRGTVIISTPKGVMTGREAKSKGVGGEILCKVY